MFRPTMGDIDRRARAGINVSVISIGLAYLYQYATGPVRE